MVGPFLGLPGAIGFNRRGKVLGGAVTPPPTPAPISAVAADGWTATMMVPADVALVPIAVTSDGFDGSGLPTKQNRALLTTKRLSPAYFGGMDTVNPPFTADTVALSDFVYATDQAIGVANASALESPKAVGIWGLSDREIVGDTLTQEVIAFHREGIACVVLTVSDGVNPVVTQTRIFPEVSPLASDKQKVTAYRFAVNVSGLADNATLTANVKIYPRLGVASSVRDSTTTTTAWGLAPRTYYRSTSRAAAPFYIYVDPVGGADVDNLASVSNSVDDAAARAARVATVQFAEKRLAAILGTAIGGCDGAEIRLYEGTHIPVVGTYTAPTVSAAIVIKPAAGAALVNTIFSFGDSANYLKCLHHRVEAITVRRGGSSFFTNLANSTLTLRNATVNCNANVSTPIMGGAGCGISLAGNTVVNYAGNAFFGGSANQQIRLVRGCDIQAATMATVEMNAALGNLFSRIGSNLSAARDQSGNVVAFNRFLRCDPTSAGVVIPFTIGSGGLIDGGAVVQNVIEIVSSNASASVRAITVSPDGGTVSTRHMIIWHNTITGYSAVGRNNWFYDELVGTNRNHTLMSVIGNLHSQLNTKHDVFVALDGNGSPNPTDAPNHVGGWSFLYGVGSRGEFSRYITPTPSQFARRYNGLSSAIASGDPLFTDYKGSINAAAVQAGGGDYTLLPGSPARGLVADSPLPFDLSGNPRSGLAPAGAYA